MMSETYDGFATAFERDLRDALSNVNSEQTKPDGDFVDLGTSAVQPQTSSLGSLAHANIPFNSHGAAGAGHSGRQPMSDSPPGGYGVQSGYGGMCGVPGGAGGHSADSPGGSGGGGVGVSNVAAKIDIDKIKQWSISTYKCTRQAIQEKMGKSQRTVDVELEQSIEDCRDLQRRYQTILRLARVLASHFYHVVETQRALQEEFTELAAKEPELVEQLKYNAETQKTLAANGDKLLTALNFFVSSVNTLCNKTIDDTLLTIRNFETARLEYDAYRADVESLQQSTSRGGDFQSKLHDAQQNCALAKEKYEQLRADVQVKMRFLADNKVKVLQKQLLLFHNATAAYFSGNAANLELTMSQFSIKPMVPNSQSMSWLEQ